MASKKKLAHSTTTVELEQYYLDIINCVPDIVYWIDAHANLKGCNQQYVSLLGLKRMNDFHGSPYEQMLKFTPWSSERVKAFKLDDMQVLFSGEAHYKVDEKPVYNKKGIATYYQSNRVPLYDKDHNIIGLVVVLSDVTHLKAEQDLLDEEKPVMQETQQHHAVPNVLMVEDNYIAQKVEEALLTECHCHVDIAGTGDKAVSLFDPGKYDIVLMDIGLEDTSGYVVAKKIRQMEQNTSYHVPIIALTSYQADVVKYDCSDYFMDGVLTKPLTREQVEQIIQHYIYHQNVSVNGLKSVSLDEKRKQ